MKKAHRDRLANALVGKLSERVLGADEDLKDEDEVELEDRERVRECLREADRGEVETSIESTRALLDRLDLTEYGSEVSWDSEYRAHHARGVLANAFFALYGGFGERPTIEA